MEGENTHKYDIHALSPFLQHHTHHSPVQEAAQAAPPHQQEIRLVDSSWHHIHGKIRNLAPYSRGMRGTLPCSSTTDNRQIRFRMDR